MNGFNNTQGTIITSGGRPPKPYPRPVLKITNENRWYWMLVNNGLVKIAKAILCLDKHKNIKGARYKDE